MKCDFSTVLGGTECNPIRTRAGGSLAALVVTLACVSVMVLSSGCGLVYLANNRAKTVIGGDAASPDGATRALLVHRLPAPFSSDPEKVFLIVAPSSETVAKAMKERDRSKYLVFYADGTVRIDIFWQDDATLVVSRISGGVRSLNVHKQMDTFGPVKIVYRGFLEAPAVR